MLHIASSNWFMDCQKYPKSRTSIRIRQPETLDSIKCHTSPGMGDRTLDILLHDSTLQFFLCQKVLIERAHLNIFIVLYNGVESDFMACTPKSPPVWLGTTELTNLNFFGPTSLAPIGGLAGCFGPTSLAPIGGLAGCWPSYPPIHVNARAGDVITNNIFFQRNLNFFQIAIKRFQIMPKQQLFSEQ